MPRILCVISVLVVALAMAVPVSGQSTVFVSTNDGTLLATDVYEPFGSGPHPVISISTSRGAWRNLGCSSGRTTRPGSSCRCCRWCGARVDGCSPRAKAFVSPHRVGPGIRAPKVHRTVGSARP